MREGRLMAIDFKRIDHIAMAVEDVDRQVAIFEGVFGFRRTSTWEAVGERGVLLTFGNGDILWEVVQPGEDGAALRSFLDGPRGPGVHHVGVHVDDLGATEQALLALGIRPASASTEDQLVVSADGAGEGVQFRFFTADAPPNAQPGQASGEGKPSLGIVALDHVCTAYPDRDALSDHYAKMLGMKQVWRTPDEAWPDFGDCILEIPGAPINWEVIQPVGDESFIQSFLDRRGPSVHHVAFEVADFDAAKRACEFHEIPTFDEHDDSTDGFRWRDAFIHPKFTGGLLTQIFWEEQPGVWERSDKVRPEGYSG
ncbi:MAG: VOC family protein [Gemmatimonadota bacterium]